MLDLAFVGNLMYFHFYLLKTAWVEGTFDIENGNLPIKSPPKEDGAAEQVPLLTQEEAASTKSNASEKGKVR